jgi:hypothetical protein
VVCERRGVDARDARHCSGEDVCKVVFAPEPDERRGPQAGGGAGLGIPLTIIQHVHKLKQD